MTQRTCQIKGCGNQHKARGWCRTHYERWQKHGDPLKTLKPSLVVGTVEDRFWAKVDKTESGCWLWNAYCDRDGYGSFKARESRHAHRFSYELSHGPVPSSMQLDHLCHTNDPNCTAGAQCPHRRCVNPDHLEPVTAGENTRRSKWPNSTKTHCPEGHKYTEANTYIDPRGGRHCRSCGRASGRRYRARRRGGDR